MLNDLCYLLTITFVVFVYDLTTNPCIKNKQYTSSSVFIVLFIHHFMSIFSKFGFLVSDRRLLFIYLFAPTLTVLHWRFNDNKCFMTEMVSEMCGKETDFLDLMDVLNFRKDKYYYMVFAVGWIIGILRFKFILK